MFCPIPNCEGFARKKIKIIKNTIYAQWDINFVQNVGNFFKIKEPNILIIDNKNKEDNSAKEIKKEKSNKRPNNIFTKIDSNIQGDVDICEINDEDSEIEFSISLNDSLEQPKQKNDKKGINNIIKSRNSFKKMKNNLDITKNKVPIFRYPNFFNNIINNNLINKTYNNK